MQGWGVLIPLIEGNLLDAEEDIICHQVSCKGVMGSGIAGQVREKYPEVYSQYARLCSTRYKRQLLGMTQFIECSDGKVIANIFGQFDYGHSGKYTKEGALKEGLLSVRNRALKTGESVAIPHGMGCGRGGANWKEIIKIIEEVFTDCSITLYKYNE